jgi:hypothetical protein
MAIYCTEYLIGPVLYADQVEAEDWDAAQAICDNRRAHCNETVTGELVEEIEVDDHLMRALTAHLN